jgi:hypothetical protein
MLDKLEEMMNAQTDMDMGWWPVLYLRPAKDKDIDNKILLRLTLFFGSVLGIFFCLPAALLPIGSTWPNLILAFFTGWAVFFLLYKFTYAYFWNRRAKRLRIRN